MIELPSEFALPERVFEHQRALVSAYARTALDERRSRRRIVLSAAAATVLVAALLATPAFGLGDRLFDLFQGSPAPPEVQTFFAANDETRQKMFAYAEQAGEKLHDQFSPVIASEARGLFAIESPDGPIYLWAAPTEDGRQCWLIQDGAEAATGRPYGQGACDGTDGARAILPQVSWTAERPDVLIVHARVYDDAITSVAVEVEDAPAVTIPVVRGHALGTIPKGERIVSLVGQNADGDEVTKVVLRPDSEHSP